MNKKKTLFVLLNLFILFVAKGQHQDGIIIQRELTQQSTQSNFKHSIDTQEVEYFDLTSPSVIEFLGKVDKKEFEIYVGEPVGYEDNFIVYEVESYLEKIPIAIRCAYHEQTGKLIHIHFPTPANNNYQTLKVENHFNQGNSICN